MRKHLRNTLLAGAALIALPLAAHAGPTYTFTTSEGVEPSNVGTITLKQINSTTVDVLVDLSDTSLPAPQYGFLNTGGPHTPFAFTLAGTESGVTANFIHPLQPPPANVFKLNLAGGGATPYGNFGVAIDLLADNGSSNVYFGDLEFKLTRTSGLSTNDFISNGTAYFAADLTDGPAGNTGSQAWNIRQNCDPVPEPASIAVLGVGLLGLGMVVHRRRRSAV